MPPKELVCIETGRRTHESMQPDDPQPPCAAKCRPRRLLNPGELAEFERLTRIHAWTPQRVCNELRISNQQYALENLRCDRKRMVAAERRGEENVAIRNNYAREASQWWRHAA
jgi:hypothetical protein